jgi:hypothetical protein
LWGFSRNCLQAAGLSDEQRAAVEETLVESVIAAGNHSVAGIFGAAALYPQLSTASTTPSPTGAPSAAALALQINVKEDCPSFGWEYSDDLLLKFAHFPPRFAREICRIALSPFL